MGLGGIEIDRVALFQNDGLACNIKFHLAFQYEVKLLAAVGVLIDSMYAWLGFYGYYENISLMVDEARYQSLVFISLGTLNTYSLTFTYHKI